YCHEELLRLARAGHGRAIQRALRECALAEIRIYRDVSLAVMAHMGRILGWSRPRAALLAAGIHAMYAYERLAGWHRMVSLRIPERRDALGGPPSTAPEFAWGTAPARASRPPSRPTDGREGGRAGHIQPRRLNIR